MYHLQTQVVAPVQPCPPHWPYADCGVPVEDEAGIDEVLKTVLVV